MKIQGYTLSTEVEQTNELAKGFRTGIVRAKYYDPDSTNINGEPIEINVIGCSSSYASKNKMDDCVIVLNHTKVIIQAQNNNT